MTRFSTATWCTHSSSISPDYPMASFAPGDHAALWLGDDTRQGVQNLMTAALKFHRNVTEQPAWGALCSLLDVQPDLNDSRVSRGARIDRRQPLSAT